MTGIYNRYEPNQNYDQHLFSADRVLQSAELNELQSAMFSRIGGIANALFSDGAVMRDARCIVRDNGFADLESGAIYMSGAVRGVPPAHIAIAMTGMLSTTDRIRSRLMGAARSTSGAAGSGCLAP